MLGALALTANAQVTLTLPMQSFTGVTDYNGVFNFAQFDPSLGSLISVQIDLATNFTSDITVTNTAAGASSGNVRTEVQDGLTDGTFTSPGNILTVSGELYKVTDDLLSAPAAYSLASGASTVLNVSKSSTASGLFTTGPVKTEFTGLGLVGIKYATLTGTVLANTGGNTNSTQVTTATMKATVTYRYDSSVPEPGAMALLGTGVVGAMGLAVRRRVLRKK